MFFSFRMRVLRKKRSTWSCLPPHWRSRLVSCRWGTPASSHSCHLYRHNTTWWCHSVLIYRYPAMSTCFYSCKMIIWVITHWFIWLFVRSVLNNCFSTFTCLTQPEYGLNRYNQSVIVQFYFGLLQSWFNITFTRSVRGLVPSHTESNISSSGYTGWLHWLWLYNHFVWYKFNYIIKIKTLYLRVKQYLRAHLQPPAACHSLHQ